MGQWSGHCCSSGTVFAQDVGDQWSKDCDPAWARGPDGTSWVVSPLASPRLPLSLSPVAVHAKSAVSARQPEVLAVRVPPIAALERLVEEQAAKTRATSISSNSSSSKQQAASTIDRCAPTNGVHPAVHASRDGERGTSEPPSLFDTLGSNVTVSPFTTVDYEEMTKEQRCEARRIMKDFVKTMVRGRRFTVVTASGESRTCFCALGRKLDRLRLSIGEHDKRVREVRLASIQNVSCFDGSGNWDEVSATLALDTDQCITFRLPNVEDRDNLVACLALLSSQAKQPVASPSNK